MLYFAYGSNMNIEQMQMRCPTAIPLGPLRIRGWRLVFRYFADIVFTEHEKDVVMGALWRVGPEDVMRLDEYESYDSANPECGLYDKVYFTVDGLDEPVMTYIMNSSTFSNPSEGYLKTCARGYEDFGYKRSDLYRSVLGNFVAQETTIISSPEEDDASAEDQEDDFNVDEPIVQLEDLTRGEGGSAKDPAVEASLDGSRAAS